MTTIPPIDINVLLALAWPNHQHHALAHRWLARQSGGCVVTFDGRIGLHDADRSQVTVLLD
ncbi:MAG: hypothetical protein EBU81_11205 [Proteobacteria bacterium]|nr:hypothetical protein [Pseudomonadota bacterium]